MDVRLVSLDEEVLEENNSFFANKTFQFIIRLLTALAFSFFTLYQVVLVFAVDTARIGRLIGVACFLMITIASFFALGNKKGFLKAHMILLIVGLIMNFAIKLINIPSLFGILSFSNPSSVLNCAVYICAQIGTVLLAYYFLAVRNKKETLEERKLTIVMMSIAIVLYALAFVMECVLLIGYRVNIDLSLKFTMLSRIAYYAGFIGTAIGFMLPAPFIDDEEYKEKEGDFIYSEADGEEIDLIM